MRLACLPLLVLALGSVHCASATPAPCAPSVAAAPESPPPDELTKMSNEELATKILVLTGASNLGKQVLDGMMENLRKLPGVTPQFIDRFQANAHTEELTSLVVPIYVKHYDRGTMIAIIRFYESKEGETLIASLPAVTKESMEVGRDWGKQLAQKTLADMKAGAPAKSP
jgi:hypothetical protein